MSSHLRSFATALKAVVQLVGVTGPSNGGIVSCFVLMAAGGMVVQVEGKTLIVRVDDGVDSTISQFRSMPENVFVWCFMSRVGNID